MMAEANTLELADLEGDEVFATFADIGDEIQAVAHWVDDAFGGIEAEAAKFAPAAAIRTLFASLTGSIGFLQIGNPGQTRTDS